MNPWTVLLDPRPLLPKGKGEDRVHSLADEAPASNPRPRPLQVALQQAPSEAAPAPLKQAYGAAQGRPLPRFEMRYQPGGTMRVILPAIALQLEVFLPRLVAAPAMIWPAPAAAPLPSPASRLIKPEPAPGPRAYRVPAPKPASHAEAIKVHRPADGGASPRAAREERPV